MVGQVKVRGGIPLVVIHPVDNAGQFGLALQQDAVKAAAVVRSLNLPGISGTNGCQRIGEDQTGLEKVQLAVKLQLPIVEESPIQTGQLHVPVPKQPLIGEVMNRHNRTQTGESRQAPVLFLEVNRDQARLPIIGVQDVRLEI